jgi:hypothetical protein
MRKFVFLALLSTPMMYAACPASVPSGITTCFFADYSTGSDSNAGTSEASPWKRFPGMVGCTGNCSAHTPGPGEGFILKGGMTIPQTALGWYWIWSGTSTTSSPGCTGSGCIYIGVDPLWFTGASWTRPVINAGGTAITGGTIGNTLFGCYCNFTVVDNIEFTGLFWSGVPAYGSGNNIGLAGGSPGIGTDDTFTHLYVHGWSHGTAGVGTVENPCGFTGDTSNPNNNARTILEFSIFDGSDTARDSCSAIFGGPAYVAYNEVQYVTSGMVIDGTAAVHDNTVENIVHSFDSGAHENGIEMNDSQTTLVYNNIIRHLAGSGSLGLWLEPDSGFTAYVFNNLIYDTDTGNVIDLASIFGPAGTDILWNNTVECGPDSNPTAVCVDGIGSQVTAVTLQNNHFITSAGSYWGTNGPTPTLHNNIAQTKTVANGQGYTASQTFAFSPTAAGNATVGAGLSASTLCTASGSTACLRDASYGVSYNTTNHTVSTPARTTNAWASPPDAGAYEFSGTPPPAVPSSVSIIVLGP